MGRNEQRPYWIVVKSVQAELSLDSCGFQILQQMALSTDSNKPHLVSPASELKTVLCTNLAKSFLQLTL